MISGDNGGPMVPLNLFEDHQIMGIDIPIIWGWATWSDRWKKYRFQIEEIGYINIFRKKLNKFYFFERIMIINYFLRATRKKILIFGISNYFICLRPTIINV